ncbi:PLATZ transcription factor family protein [Wolffia australiana]
MERRWAEAAAPPWLERLLTTTFFATCRIHGEAARSECNMFCLDCAAAAAFCFYCRAAAHADHRVVQIRRSSYHDVVRVSEVQKAVDVSGVQTYVINSARVVFLNERPQPKTTAATATAGGGAAAKSAAHLCEICSRTLLDPFRFCSLGCKLEGIRRSGGMDGATFLLDDGDGRVEQATTSAGNRRRAGGSDVTRAAKSRRRKGVPRRSPLTS